MKKLFQFLDNQILKIGVIFALIFTALYPKLPSIGVPNTWVYIRLEDFVIALVTFIWIIQLLRKRVKLAFPVGIPIVVYWVVGGISLIFSFIFIASHLANFFPRIAVFEWIRRIEYMVLFFVAYSTVKSVKDIRDYLIALFITVGGIVVYGIGQHYYLQLWAMFPAFFQKFSFCFPSFQTGNEEFAKGIPLCLPEGARDTSTFGGHYDLAAYLVLVLPILFSFTLAAKKKILKVTLGILFLLSLILLLFTASRISFITYFIGITAAILLSNKKKLLVPVWLLSVMLLLLFSGSTAKRFAQTVRVTSIVTNKQGQIIGVAPATLPKTLQNKIAKNPETPVVVSEQTPTQNLPAGTAFSVIPQTAPVKTSVAVVKTKVNQQLADKLKLQYGGVQISTVSGSFLIQKALVYDISFTTRFQAEWPRDFAAFLSSPIFGTGYSSLTLASDNDYLRALGETGLLGFVAFLSIFFILGIFAKEKLKNIKDETTRFYILGLTGGMIGLFANALLIDVFESSKVAEGLWILLGVGAGGLALFQKQVINYRKYIFTLLKSNIFIPIYLFIISFLTFGSSMSNFFVADDFTWLHWAASGTFRDIPKYFINAQGFFYRPLDKTIMLILYTFLSFQPEGYHVFTIFLHFLIALGVYFLLLNLFGKKFWSFAGSIIFILLPAHAEDVFWISTISTNLATLFILLTMLAYDKSIKSKNWFYFVLSLLLGVLGLFSYEMVFILPLIILVFDQLKKRRLQQHWILYVPFVAIDGLYLLVRKISHTVAAGGDYSYSLGHLIPNVIGNFIGYINLFIFGENSLRLYSILRMSTKNYSLILTVVIAGITIVAIIFLKKRIADYIENSEFRIFIFGIIFAFVSLLPFLGLGNISERYLYLASVGFVISAIAVIKKLTDFGLNKSTKLTVILGGIITILALVWFVSSLNKEQSDWQKAGEITHVTLGFFKVDQQNIHSGQALYFINRPIKYANAWIFPVGLVDGLWFIYRDDAITVHDEPSLDKARQFAGENYQYIYSFNNKGEIFQEKP